jgi:hypothetical protein
MPALRLYQTRRCGLECWEIWHGTALLHRYMSEAAARTKFKLLTR